MPGSLRGTTMADGQPCGGGGVWAARSVGDDAAWSKVVEAPLWVGSVARASGASGQVGEVVRRGWYAGGGGWGWGTAGGGEDDEMGKKRDAR